MVRRRDPNEEAELRTKAINDIVSKLLAASRLGETANIARIKSEVCSAYGLDRAPRTVDIIAAVPQEERSSLGLLSKPVRTASGVAVVAVMCKPHRCPHIHMTGNICVYCPGGPDSDFEYSSQSYTGYEPTSMRAIRARYDPYLQTRNRIEQLEQLGHDVSKVEFIVMGGTFMSLDTAYKDYFIRSLHDALSGCVSDSVDQAVRFAEKAAHSRCVGLTIETRPDYCLRPHLTQMLSYACTRLEIGVQSVYEDVARDTNRGHTVRSVCESFQLAKDSGFKIVAHMMPDLPNVDFDRDVASFRELFENPNFRPDGVKIYPTLVMRGTGVYELWKQGQYVSYAPSELLDLLCRVLAAVPPYTRIYRVQRDIPLPLVSASAVNSGNLREHCSARLEELGLRCRDIRTREAGIQALHVEGRVELVRRDYWASEGWETFLAYEDPVTDTLLGMLRLRQPSSDSWHPNLREQTSIVRELHVYGTVVGVGSRDLSRVQHRGLGTLLMSEAERVAKEEHGSSKLAVISGVGTREYYKKLGYCLEGPYMIKQL